MKALIHPDHPWLIAAIVIGIIVWLVGSVRD